MQDSDERDLAATEPVGDRLRAAREAAALSLDQVSARTRIRVPVLQDLEADRLGPATSAVYTRGHIRAIASAVGVDPTPLVRDFDARVGARVPGAAAAEPVPLPRPPVGSLSVPQSAPPERPRWLQACVAGAGVLVALLAVGVLAEDGAEQEQAAPARAETTTAPGQAQPAAPAPAAAALVLTAHGTSWLSVSNAATTLFEGVVEDGWSRRFEDASALSVRVGNAAAVAASCGGATAGPEGEEGAVLTLTCTSTGLQRQ